MLEKINMELQGSEKQVLVIETCFRFKHDCQIFPGGEDQFSMKNINSVYLCHIFE